MVIRFGDGRTDEQCLQSPLYSNIMFACLLVCLRPISSGTAGLIWRNLFVSEANLQDPPVRQSVGHKIL